MKIAEAYTLHASAQLWFQLSRNHFQRNLRHANQVSLHAFELVRVQQRLSYPVLEQKGAKTSAYLISLANFY